MVLAKSLLIITLGFYFQISTGLKLIPQGDSPEESCPVVHADQTVNMTWLTSMDHWYVHALNKEDIYESLRLATTEEEFASLTDEEVQKTCFMLTQFVSSPKTIKFYGMNRKFSDFEISFPKYRKGVMDWAITGPDPQHAITSYVVQTDNKSYFAAIDIFEDGAKGFYIASPLSSIPSEEMDKKKKLMERHGFSKDSFYPLQTDCEHDEYLNNIKKSLSSA